MWILIWTALLFSVTERATCQNNETGQPQWTITMSPENISIEAGLCAVINCSFTHPTGFTPTAKRWRFGPHQLTFSLPLLALSQKPSVVCPPLTVGQRATLTCTAPGLCSGSPPQITWTWRKTGDNTTEIKGNTTEYRPENLTSILTKHSSYLTFTPSAEHHNTSVACRVIFMGNITTEEAVWLDVTYAKEPQILRNTAVREGGVLNLTCPFYGNPPSSSTVVWSKSGSPMLQNDTGSATLVISNMTRGDVGEYTCTVQHDNNTRTASAHVDVLFPPEILNGSGCEVQSGVQTCLCVSSGFPLPLIGWLNVEGYSFSTSVLGSSVNSTINLPVKGLTSATVELKSSKSSKGDTETLEMITCNDQQATGNDQTPQKDATDRAQENGAALTCENGGEPKEADYADIDFSLLKKKSSEEVDKKTERTDTEYAELKPQKRTKEQVCGGEASDRQGEEGEEGEAMIGEEEQTEVSAEETDEGTKLYSNV
ncbi:uncharacterized protein FYW47_006299 [Aplochiton taeniatus]